MWSEQQGMARREEVGQRKGNRNSGGDFSVETKLML
jgi:hypothetical protein